MTEPVHEAGGSKRETFHDRAVARRAVPQAGWAVGRVGRAPALAGPGPAARAARTTRPALAREGPARNPPIPGAGVISTMDLAGIPGP